MKSIQITFVMNDEMVVESIEFNHNNTELKSDSKLLKALGKTLIECIDKNADECEIQDMLYDLNIGRAEQ